LTQEELYSRLAKYYDSIYHWKDYKKEAQEIRRLIRRYKKSSGNSLLDVACGTGAHLSYLQSDFECEGVDISEDMIAVAKKNIPLVKLGMGNMVDFDLGKQFDVVLCLFSSIGYLQTDGEISKAISNFARHLKPGGVLMIEPFFTRSEWIDGSVHMQTNDSDSLKIARVSFSQSKPGFALFDEEYLIGEAGKGIGHVRDHHKMRFFEPEVYSKAVTAVGLNYSYLKRGLMPRRGLLVCTRPKGIA